MLTFSFWLLLDFFKKIRQKKVKNHVKFKPIVIKKKKIVWARTSAIYLLEAK